jgi:hypothetical protein
MKYTLSILLMVFLFVSCKKEEENPSVGNILIDSILINNVLAPNNAIINNVDYLDVEIIIHFNTPVDTNAFIKSNVFFSGDTDTLYYHSFSQNRQELTLRPLTPFEPLSGYRLNFYPGPNLGGIIMNQYTFVFRTALDSTLKFPVISDEELLTLVQRQTFKYFWDYGHPVSGLIRERLGSGDLVTSGGSGFGLMVIITGIQRGFITRSEGFERLSKIVSFLIRPETDKYHGVFPHWLNGSTGKTIPFSAKDDGADLVETAFLMQGLLTVREYFRNGSEEEKAMCETIDTLWQNVNWNFHRKNEENVLYWHWSPHYGWEMNHQIRGWNEALIVYVLAASSPTYPIPKSVYDIGWARNGSYPMINNNTFYSIKLPLGENLGGPLFFTHYSFLGLDPRNLSDQYANYWEQNTAHTLINYNYCVANPKNFVGYSEDCWGLTASDVENGYRANSPTNDIGVITPTAALSSFPYTPEQSMDALKFFYYVLGDKIWGEFGFNDAFNLTTSWFANSYLAIDQGPIVCMIENHRSGLLWDLFMQNPDIQAGAD